ncbi:MAG: hypothetical protein C0503_10890 [Gemmatimonas sp.]|nr:hypothetical protein [Gemmatimonas sp.]
MIRLLLLAMLVVNAACYSFAGGGLPPHVRTVAVLPFDNESGSPELPRELQDALREGMQSRLGLRDASEERASAIVRGRITRYEFDIPVAFSADPTQATSARRRLRVQVNIEIVDQVTGRVLWSRSGMTAEGEYAERNEIAGRRQAIDRIVNDVIEGAQSQW